MLPRRKLSEIFTSATLNKRFCNVLVEGPTDHIILRSFCEGEKLSVLIYPSTAIELDEIGPTEGGNKGRLIKTSELASARNQVRLFCVIDRDEIQVAGFQLNSHCLITDLSCLEMYALDVQELHGYLQRHFQFDCTFDVFLSVVSTARLATWLHWRRVAHVENVGLANIDRSLSVQEDVVRLNLPDWIERSKVRGGAPEAWGKLLSEAEQLADPEGDPRTAMSVHCFDDVLRFWLRKSAGATLTVGWAERHLRGLATYERLSAYPFFEAIKARCVEGLQA